MKPIAQNQIITIHTLLPAQVKQDAELKATLISQYTGDVTKTSTRDLSFSQAYELIKDLQNNKKHNPTVQRSDKMRKKIISMAHDIGWQYFSTTKNRMVADVKHIEDWCNKYSYLHKSLNSYTYAELPALVTQFEQVYKDALNKK